jgi:para-nitrobenzyl esterase
MKQNDSRNAPSSEARRSLLQRSLALGSVPWLMSPLAVWAQSNLAVVQAPAGRFRGERLAALPGQAGSMLRFLGIRYGEDTAAHRFGAPRPAARAKDAVDAVKFGPVSPQRARTLQTQSEDCLFLNLWTPAPGRSEKRPVMVYIHGGAYATGSGNDPLTDGAQLARNGDVVVVTLTHRLNIFGYLYLSRIDERFPDSGNAGQLDLILALQWVRENIADFGGDPGNVTVFGQSGGGAKIATLMAMPAAKGLFHKAITMSGQQVTASGPLNATRRTRAFLDKLGKSARDIHQASIAELVAALDATDPILGGGAYFGPVLDSRHLLRHPFYPDAHPQGLSVPMMLGNCVAETRAFFPPGHARLKDLNWENLAERVGPELRVDIAPERVVAKYREWFPAYSPEQVFIAATTAGRSWRGQIIEAEERARAGSPAWVYQLDFENAMHTADIALSFGTLPANASEAQRAMSDRIQQTFLRFAKTGQPGWPVYTLERRETMVWDVQSRVERDPRGRERELFAVVPYVQPGS